MSAPPPQRPLLPLWLTRLCGNAPTQRALAGAVDLCHAMMGIGTGGYVLTSGEGAVLERVARAGRPPYVVFDVGAHKGWFANLVLDAFPADAVELHCFEPCASTFRLLGQNVAAGPRVRLNPCALGDRPREEVIYYDEPDSGRASLTRLDLAHRSMAFDRSERVRIETLDAYCVAAGVDRIDLLKIDVEGHEMDVLTGAAGMFERGAIAATSFEFGKCHVDTRIFFKDFYQFFQRMQMHLFRITPSGYLAPIRAYDEGLEQFKTANFVAATSHWDAA